jgi:hypothetical protein
MKKIVSTILVTVLASSVAYASHFGDNLRHRHQQIKNGHHIVVHHRPHHVRPHKRHIVIRRHFYRPHYVSLRHRLGHRIHRLHPATVSLSVGGVGYHYSNGAFYRPYRTGFRVVSAPIGAVIGSLPLGYRTLHLNNHTYYRYEDTYYDRCSNGYRVIEEPVSYNIESSNITNYQYQIGDIALNLPVGAMEVIIDGRRYYEAQGQYFKEIIRNGQSVYEVVSI